MRHGHLVATIVDESELANRSLAFSLRVRELGAIADIVDALLCEMEFIGMTVVASGVVSGPKMASRRPFHFHNWPDTWVSHTSRETTCWSIRCRAGRAIPACL